MVLQDDVLLRSLGDMSYKSDSSAAFQILSSNPTLGCGGDTGADKDGRGGDKGGRPRTAAAGTRGGGV